MGFDDDNDNKDDDDDDSTDDHHCLPVFLMFAHLAALLLVTAHLLQLVPAGSGTLSLVMLLLQHRCCHFVEN